MLFPAIQPGQTWRFPVSDLHTLYLEECGNPNGVPIVFLHGGPGGSCEPGHRRFFDPESYRIILFDQRGAGKSRPHASLENNTTPELIADLEKIREFLKIERWVVFGGSWGSTLALAYAQTHPERVMGLILRGIFLARERDVDWFFGGHAARVYPEAWEHFIEPIPPEERDASRDDRSSSSATSTNSAPSRVSIASDSSQTTIETLMLVALAAIPANKAGIRPSPGQR